MSKDHGPVRLHLDYTLPEWDALIALAEAGLTHLRVKRDRLNRIGAHESNEGMAQVGDLVLDERDISMLFQRADDLVVVGERLVASMKESRGPFAAR